LRPSNIIYISNLKNRGPKMQEKVNNKRKNNKNGGITFWRGE
jgi:hypothetical protein